MQQPHYWVHERESRSVVSDSLRPQGLHSPWNSPGQNTRVGSPSLLQGIFQTQKSNPDLLHCRQILCQLSHRGSPRVGSLPIPSPVDLPNPGSSQGLLHCRWILYQLSYVHTTKEFSFFKSSFHCAWLKSATMTSTSLLYRKGAPTGTPGCQLWL